MGKRGGNAPDGTAQVDALLEQSHHPLKADVVALRHIIKGVHPRIMEAWKWNAPSFSYRDEYLVTFNLRDQQRVHLVFHHPEIATIESALLEGDYPDRRMMYLEERADVETKREALTQIVMALVALIDARQGPPEPESDFPKLGAPARRALEAAGYRRLEQLTAVTEAELGRLHGMGPNALGKLREALEAQGLGFARRA